MKKSIFILIFCLFIIELSANEFQKLTTLDGLSQNDVNYIFQDSRGFIWIGTNDGLNRYDGYDFKVFRKAPRQQGGLRSNIINSIVEDTQGNLWIGSIDNGVSKYNVSTNKFTSIINRKNNSKLLTSNGSLKLLADSKGNIWVLSNKGIDVINSKTNNVERVLESEGIGTHLRSIFEDKEGVIWVGTLEGLLKFNVKTNKVEKEIKLGMTVVDMAQWGNDLLLSNDGGVYKFNEERNNAAKLPDVLGGKSILVEANNLWVASFKKGVYLYKLIKGNPISAVLNSVKWNSRENDFNNYNVSSLLKDNSGLIWIGTSGGGIEVYNPKGQFFKHHTSTKNEGSLSHKTVRSVLEDNYQNLWIGTENGGLNFLSIDNKNNYDTGFISLLPNHTFVTVLSLDKKNDRVWVGLPAGLKTFSSKTGKEIFLSKRNFKELSSVFSILIDSQGIVWVGTYGKGLWRLKLEDDGKYSSTQFLSEGKNNSLSSDIVRSLLEDKDGNIWIGTSIGLNKIKFEEKLSSNLNFKVFKNDVNNELSISHNYILPLFESSKGDLWIGTLGGGLNKLCENETGTYYFETLTTKEGLPNNVIKGILEDEQGNLWISSNKGISRINPEDKSIRNFGVSDGLQDFEFRDFACYKRKSGEMIFGGVNGFNTFFPDDMSLDTTVNKVVFTDLEILNQPINVGDEFKGRVILNKSINNVALLELKYQENSFTIYFSGLHFASPSKNQYKYKLIGFDDSWVSMSSNTRFAKYTNLSPGNYTLNVVASNSDGYWNNNPKAIKIIVQSPWWFSRISITIYILLFLLSLWFFRRFTIIGIQRKSQLIMESFEKEKIQKLSQMKLKFFTNISHEFRTPLTLIIGPISKLIKERESMSGLKVKENYEIINRNANSLLRLINQLMDFRKFEQDKISIKASEGNLVAFIQKVVTSFNFMADQKEIEFSFEHSTTNLPFWFDANKLEKVLMNLLSNAFKFTNRKGKVEVKLVEEDNQISIIVEDNGIGISKDKQEFVFNRFFQADKFEDIEVEGTGIGLSYVKGLVEMHYGDIELISEEEQGTKFIVTLFKGNNHFKGNELLVKKNFQSFKSEDVLIVEGENIEPVLIEVEIENDKPKVLIVEDNIELRKFIVNNLNEYYIIVEAENGEEGLKQCEINFPDLIVSDVMMPKMDGFEMCKTLKQDVNYSHIPIVLLTAKTATQDKVKGYTLGANAYVEKPFDLEVLKAQIDSLLRNKKQLQEKFKNVIDIEPSEFSMTKVDDALLTKILQKIESKISDKDLTVQYLALECGMSQTILNKKLKALSGKTTNAFIRSVRLKRAAKLLSTGNYSVSDVTYEVGFSDLKYFRNSFKEEFSISPSDFKRKNSKNS
ncbi:hybrid sensor histidine kinase/response regulator transcription factor [Lutibacter citreus]|uniref:hybrid sensor histidine kinase/response regulator transcription factor n=1 Tax=Lutibacter citreus TaxID=2138210 RepID=UPI000DBE686B|nr:hybrid sensor histidine kinase/response regulator transcription factor [Lutibacter citreus]